MDNEYEEMDAPFVGEETAVEPTPEPVVAEEVAATEPPEAEETETDEVEEHPKKKSGSQRLKDKLQRVEEEKEFWRQEALKTKSPEVPTTKAPQGEPKIDDFGTHEEWMKASIRFEATRLMAEERAREESARASQSWNEKAEKAKAKYEDFDDALQSAPNPAPAVLKVIQKSPVGADIAYHLATHGTEYQRINSMAPEDAAYELGQLALKFIAPVEPPPKKTTKAPAPIVPLAPSGLVPAALHPNFEEF